MRLRHRGFSSSWPILVLAVVACDPGVPGESSEAPGAATAGEGVPVFEYDPTWPKTPLPNQWMLGEIGGMAVDDQNHIWVIQRPWTVIDRELGAAEGISSCCRAAPPVIEFDQEGNVVQAWPQLQTFFAEEGSTGGQGFSVGRGGQTLYEAAPGPYGEWGRREHTVYVDPNGFVWTTNDESHVIYKFTRAGEWLLTIGEKGVTRGSNSQTALGRPAGLVLDPATNELFVADGYTNKRVIVFDAETGAYKRHWGAYGNPPEDVDLGPYDPSAPPAQQFLGPVHGIALARDGLLYVTDRSADRIQVFRTNGEFVTEGFVSPETRDLGTGYGIALSHDPEQRFVYVNDGSNNVIWILRRSDLVTVGNFSSYGRMGGQVMSAHSIAVDQQGNVYIGETRGRRVQRFAFRGFM
jgi:DNA-binding beta-propeller fold protein YncE